MFHLRQRNGGIIEALRYLEREGESGKISKNAAGIRVQPSRGRIVELKSINYPKVSDSFQAMKLGPGHHGRAFEIQASAAAMLPFFYILRCYFITGRSPPFTPFRPRTVFQILSLFRLRLVNCALCLFIGTVTYALAGNLFTGSIHRVLWFVPFVPLDYVFPR